MSSEDVDLLEEKAPGYLASRLALGSSRINAQLRKGYAVPFVDPVPEIVFGWLTSMVTPEAYRKRGWDPADEQSVQIEQDRKDALAEIKEAADSENGLFDLPLRDDTDSSARTHGGPFAYSEPSPYDWLDVQAEALRDR